MTFPNDTGKHNAESVFTVEDLLADEDIDAEETPDAVILCYQDAFFEDVVAEYTDGEALREVGGGGLYRITERVGVLGEFGIGSPVTAGVVAEQAARGTDAFCILGGAGCLDPEIPPEQALLATSAIRDEGASHHYLPPEQRVAATPALRERVRSAVTDAGIGVESGPTWTIDAFFRETVPEVRQYREDGVLSVEMEAATLFALAAYHDFDAAAVFAIGDYVTAEDRTVPDASHELLPELVEPTVAALQRHLEE